LPPACGSGGAAACGSHLCSSPGDGATSPSPVALIFRSTGGTAESLRAAFAALVALFAFLSAVEDAPAIVRKVHLCCSCSAMMWSRASRVF
jgi:hypothetical protein